jgi:hypothetical protein
LVKEFVEGRGELYNYELWPPGVPREEQEELSALRRRLVEKQGWVSVREGVRTEFQRVHSEEPAAVRQEWAQRASWALDHRERIPQYRRLLRLYAADYARRARRFLRWETVDAGGGYSCLFWVIDLGAYSVVLTTDDGGHFQIARGDWGIGKTVDLKPRLRPWRRLLEADVASSMIARRPEGEESCHWVFLTGYDGKRFTHRVWAIPPHDMFADEQSAAVRYFRAQHQAVSALWYGRDYERLLEEIKVSWYVETKLGKKRHHLHGPLDAPPRGGQKRGESAAVIEEPGRETEEQGQSPVSCSVSLGAATAYATENR